MRLWLRLFLACAALAVLTWAGFLAWQRQAFLRGFQGYLDAIAADRAHTVAERLLTRYRRDGGWDPLRRDPDAFGAIVDPNGPATSRARPDDPPPGEPPRFPRGQGDGDPRTPRGPGDGDSEPHRGPHPDGPGRPRPGPPPDGFRDRPHGPPPEHLDAGTRLALYDAEGRYVAGNTQADAAAPTVAVMVDDVVVGSVRILPLALPSGGLEDDFARQQLGGAAIAAGVALAIALLLSLLLARRLLRPVRALTRATESLAAGDYASRVAVQGRDELALLATHFNRLAAALDDNRTARQRWGTDIAHELRTPLTVLQMELTTLVEGIRTPTAAALRSLLAECERLSALTEDLYQLSLADSGALEYRFEATDLAALVADLVPAHAGLLDEQGIELDAAIPLVPVLVRGDPVRLGQLLDNLLVNSRRYTEPPGRIEVRLSTIASGVELIVEDTPPAVAADDLPRLFERLFRAESSRSRARGGAGLGLAICRAIVDAHQGLIRAEASPLGGLRVVVELPSWSSEPHA